MAGSAMSAAQPTAILLPVSATPAPRPQAHDSSDNATDATSDDFKPPLLRLQLRDLGHEASKIFLGNIDAATDLDRLVNTVVKWLYRARASSDEDEPRQQPSRGGRTVPFDPAIPATRSVTLVVRDMDGVAYTTSLDLDRDHKEIHLAFAHIVNTATESGGDKAKIRHELLGVLCHELVHCYQDFSRNSNEPGGLTEGLADWVRLRAGLGASHWKIEAGPKVKWDAGYQTTAYFLDWIENAYGEGSVRRINHKLSVGSYKEKTFWNELFGKTVHELWVDYSASLEKN